MNIIQKILIIFFFLLLIPLYLFRLRQTTAYQLPENQPIKLVGRISRQPYLKGSNQIITVGPVVVRTSRFPGYFYGQKVELVGNLEKQVLSPFRIQYFTYYPAIRIVKNDRNITQTTIIRQTLLKIRGRFEDVISRYFSEPESSLLNGILLGVKKELPENFSQNLRKTGTIHVVVASGQNLSILANFLMTGLVWLFSRKKALLISFLAMMVYILMVGAEAPVVRAGIMAGLAYLAQFFGRQEEGIITLILAGGIMLLISPLILFDLGFQLSFSATAGIICFYPWFKGRRFFARPGFGEALATTLAAQLGVTPIILSNFGQVSFLSPLVNGLILWTVPLLMVFGGATVLVGLALNSLGQLLAWLTWPLLALFVGVIDFFGRMPWISRQVGRISPIWTVGYYLVLLYFAWKIGVGKKNQLISSKKI